MAVFFDHLLDARLGDLHLDRGEQTDALISSAAPTDGDLVLQRDVAQRQLLLDLVEPGVRLDLLDGVALVDVAHQDAPQQVLGFRRHEARDRVLAGQDLLVQQALAVFVERQVAAEHRVERDPAAPHVDGHGRVELAVDDLLSEAYLGRGVAGRAAGGFELLFFGVEVAEAEVYELEVLVFVDEDVRGLDVAVRAADLVQVLDGGDELAEELAGFELGEPGSAERASSASRCSRRARRSVRTP